MATLTLQVMGGLCSRLRAVLGAMAHCEATGKDLIVNWPRYQPNLPDGFEARMSDIWRHSFEEIDDPVPYPKDESALVTEHDSQLRTCHIEPFKRWITRPFSEYWWKLKPVDSVRQKAHDTVQKFAKCTVGVNIRQHLRGSNMTEPEWLFGRMRSITEHSPNVLFFVATGDQEMAERVASEFNVLTLEKSYNYDYQGVLDHAAELYALSSCEWILGTANSSYSQMAALLSGSEYAGDLKVRGGRYEDQLNGERRFEDDC